MWDIKADAEVEKTALETLIGEVGPMGETIRNGGCTEQSKFLYAVLRMSGIRASFVEPHLPIDYLVVGKKIKKLEIPLPAHVAAGVGVKIKGTDGKENPWILDMSLKQALADYSERYSYFEVSLRHYWMMDLSNLGGGQSKAGKTSEAQETYELALRLGKDSTIHYVMSSYSALLSTLWQSSGEHRKDKIRRKADSLTENAFKVNYHGLTRGVTAVHLTRPRPVG